MERQVDEGTRSCEALNMKNILSIICELVLITISFSYSWHSESPAINKVSG